MSVTIYRLWVDGDMENKHNCGAGTDVFKCSTINMTVFQSINVIVVSAPARFPSLQNVF